MGNDFDVCAILVGCFDNNSIGNRLLRDGFYSDFLMASVRHRHEDFTTLRHLRLR